MKLLFKKGKKEELRFLKKNLEKFEKDMFGKLNDLESTLEDVRTQDQKKYEKILDKEVVQLHNFEKLTSEIINSVESLEKNQKVLKEEIALFKDKIKE